MIRDACGPRALETLLRYRASAQAELFRALGALKVLQAEAAPAARAAAPAAPRLAIARRDPATGLPG